MTTTRSFRIPERAGVPEALGRALGKWQSAVVRLGAVDAITTEMVRLRCARHHDCHTCLSVRSADARQQGLDEDDAARAFGADPDGLEPHHRAALALADALMTQPSGLDDATVAELRRHFSDEQLVELTVDVMKWNYQKAMVAMGTDLEVKPGELADLVFDENGHWVRPT